MNLLKLPSLAAMIALSLIGSQPLHAQQRQGQDPRLIWTAKKDAKVSFSIRIDGENHARVVIWRSLELNDGKFDKEQKIFEKDFTNAQAHPRTTPLVLTEEQVANNSIKYRVEVFTSRTKKTELQSLSGDAMKEETASCGAGITLKFNDWLPFGEKNGDFDDIILTIRED